MSTKAATPVEPSLEEVTLLKAHTHAGEAKKAGDKIAVNEADKAWLIANQVIAAPAAATK